MKIAGTFEIYCLSGSNVETIGSLIGCIIIYENYTDEELKTDVDSVLYIERSREKRMS